MAGSHDVSVAGSPGARAIVWLRPDQAGLVRAACASAGLQVVGAGGPGRSGVESSAALDVPVVSSLRDALLEGACDVLWLHAPDTNDDALDHAHESMLARAVARGVRVATTEPLPTSLLDSDAPALFAGEPGAPRLARVPGAWSDDLARDLGESLGAFGRARAGSIESLCAPRHGSLALALMHAIELALALVGPPEAIDAVYTQGDAPAGLHTLPSETLADLSGTISAVLRYADGRGLTLLASDASGAWSRRVELIGPAGVLRHTGDAWSWTDREGRTVDSSTPEHEPPEPVAKPSLAKKGRRPADDGLFDARTSATETSTTKAGTTEAGATPPPLDTAHALFAEALRLLVRGAWPLPVTDRVTPLAVAQAALLSARTGNAESPETMRRLSRR
ncbi:MAG: hypothetical protein RBS39_00500 [Phycisphaerales bacterium]|nr:hypothetical protein [Phycisphaerales bacterium]